MKLAMRDDPAWLQALTENIAGRENLVTVIRYTAIVGLAAHVLFIPLFLLLGVAPMVVFNVFSCGLFLTSYWLTRRGRAYLALWLGVAEIVVHAVLAVAFVGWDSGFGYFILCLTPLIFYSHHWRFSFKIWVLIGLCALYIALFLAAVNREPWIAVDPVRLGVTGAINAVIAFFVLAALAYAYRQSAITAETALLRVNRVLVHQAHTDPLTHLPNRRHMHAELLQAIDDYHATQAAFCVVMGDIDHFKEFNDRYGHDAGDAILVRIAEAIRASLRDHDRVARWGGEEFLILLADTSLDHARVAAERLLERVRATRIVVDSTPVAVTLTLGASAYAGEPDATACINRADAALYLAKAAGRNRVVTLSADEETRPAVPGRIVPAKTSTP